MACEAIRKSSKFKSILEIILAVGNYMNDSSKQASGFKLGTLQRLAFTKDEKNTMTFLHYVEKIVRTSFPELDGFVDDLRDAMSVSKLSIEQLKTDCTEFMAMIKNCQTSIDVGNLSDSSVFHPKDKILQTVLASLPEARKKREFLGDQLKQTMSEFNRLMKYFGDDPHDSAAVSSFFSKFSNFVIEYQKVNQENIYREQENRAYEARKKLQETPKKVAQLEAGQLAATGQSSPSGSVMDNLLEKLRAARPSADARMARRRATARKHMIEQRRALTSDSPLGSPTSVGFDLSDAGSVGIDAAVTEGLRTEHDSDIPQSSLLPDISPPVFHGSNSISGDLEDSGSSGSVQRGMSSGSGGSGSNESGSGRPDSSEPGPVSSIGAGHSRSGSGSDGLSGRTASPETAEDDVGGRARQLLIELRSGSSEYGMRNSEHRPSSARLAEIRARNARLKSKSQDLRSKLPEISSEPEDMDEPKSVRFSESQEAPAEGEHQKIEKAQEAPAVEEHQKIEEAPAEEHQKIEEAPAQEENQKIEEATAQEVHDQENIEVRSSEMNPVEDSIQPEAAPESAPESVSESIPEPISDPIPEPIPNPQNAEDSG